MNMDKAQAAVEAIATHAGDNAVKLVGFPEDTYHYSDNHKVVVCRCTGSVHVQFANLWAYYAPDRRVSFQEGDEELLIETAARLEDGTFFAL
jgi:hypothetical protein